MSSSDPSAAAADAARERRRAKVLANGRDRLARVSGTARACSQSPDPARDADAAGDDVLAPVAPVAALNSSLRRRRAAAKARAERADGGAPERGTTEEEVRELLAAPSEPSPSAAPAESPPPAASPLPSRTPSRSPEAPRAPPSLGASPAGRIVFEDPSAPRAAAAKPEPSAAPARATLAKYSMARAMLSSEPLVSLGALAVLALALGCTIPVTRLGPEPIARPDSRDLLKEKYADKLGSTTLDAVEDQSGVPPDVSDASASLSSQLLDAPPVLVLALLVRLAVRASFSIAPSRAAGAADAATGAAAKVEGPIGTLMQALGALRHARDVARDLACFVLVLCTAAAVRVGPD